MPGHAFVDITCIDIKRTVSFFPEINEFQAFQTFSLSKANVVKFGFDSAKQHPILHSYLSATVFARLAERQFLGKLTEDQLSLELCRKTTCAYSKHDISKQQAQRALLHIERIRQALQLQDTEAYYRLFGNNCIDFMKNTMDSTGIVQWKNRWSYSVAPSLIDRITALGWHYFTINYLIFG